VETADIRHRGLFGYAGSAKKAHMVIGDAKNKCPWSFATQRKWAF
jgi:hypothetical protein